MISLLFDSDFMKIDICILSNNSTENEDYIRLKHCFNGILYLHFYFRGIILLFKKDDFFGNIEV